MAGIKTPSDVISGPVYNVAHFSTAYLNVAPNLHRLSNAVGLTVGLFLGRKAMDIIVGQTPDGTTLDIKDVPLALRPLYGILPYDHFSDDPKHRWMKVFDMSVPAVLGGLGAGIGSNQFSQEKFLKPVMAKMGVLAKDFTMIDAEKRALYHQGRPLGLTSMLSAVFGSASGFGLFPSFLNYSSTLGAKFTLYVERAMVAPWLGTKLRASLLNSHHPLPFRPTKTIHDMAHILVENPTHVPKEFDELAQGVLKTWFRGVNETKAQAFADIVKEQCREFMATAKADKLAGKLDNIEAQVLKKLDSAVETLLIKAKIDPREARIGDSGFITTWARWIGDLLPYGTTKRLKETQALMIKGLEERHPELAGKAFTAADLTESTLASKIAAGTLLGTGVATIGAIATAKDTTVNDLTPGSNDTPGKSFAAPAGPQKHIVHSKKERGFINGRVLDTAEGITGMFNAGIGMHRVHCAVGLTVGSWLGDEIMKAMTGRTFGGAKVAKEQLFQPLQRLHGILPFDPHSGLAKDKWMQVLRWGVPGILGMVAVMQGSKLFFEERSHKINKAKYLDEMEDKASMAQSEPWSYTSAISSLMGFPTGIPMMPLLNYSTNLGTRFSMAAGRKVAMPILGKIWSNNPTLFPYGPSGMIDLLIREAVNNKSTDPELLETYTIGILKPWFDNVTPQQVEAFVQQVHAVRDHFLKVGGVPEDMKIQLEAELKAHLKGAGLEETLEQIGLDPKTAHIGNNGLSGAIANALGAGKHVRNLSAEYGKGYAERLKKRREESTPDHNLSA